MSVSTTVSKGSLPTLLIVLERGDDVFQALREALAEHAVGNAWIVGRGSFDEIELRDGDVARTFSSQSRIVSLDGRARAGFGGGELTLSATVARSSARGPEFLVGSVVRAIAFEVELLVTPLDRVSSRTESADSAGIEASEEEPSSPDERPGRPIAARSLATKPEGPPSPWAVLADASAEAHARPPVTNANANSRGVFAQPAPRAPVVAPKAPRGITYDPRPVGSPPNQLPPPTAPVPPRRKSTDEEIYPEPGDLLDHFTFGRCVVLQSDGDELIVQNPTSGRTRTIRISALHAEEPTEEDGKRLFRLTQRRTP